MKKLTLCLVLLGLCTLTFAGCETKKAAPKPPAPPAGAPAGEEKATPPAGEEKPAADATAPAAPAEPAK